MLISEFARVTGLTRDTVRFYARLGLLRPQTNGKGGRHPYSVFTDKDVQAAEIIRILQSLGMSLKEIVPINEERRNGELTCERSLEITRAQLARLEAKATELEMMISYVRAKIAWLTRGKRGRQPHFGSYMRRGSRINGEQTDSTVEGTVKQPSIA
jgi:MerR family copper efflux transcriptional regulator